MVRRFSLMLRSTLFPARLWRMSLLLLIVAVAVAACSNNGDNSNGILPTLAYTATPSGNALNAPSELSAEYTGVLEHWVPATNRLSSGGVDRWRFTGLAGDEIRIRVLPLDETTLETSITLMDENEQILQADQRIDATLPAAGIYVVMVEAVTGEGEYEIGLSYADQTNPNDDINTPVPELVGVPTPVPAYAEVGNFIASLQDEMTFGSTMEPGLDNHVYTFEGMAGQYVQVEMQRVSGMIDPILTLYDPDGNAIAIDDDSAGAQAAALRNIRLPIDGLYLIEAGGSNLAGGYSIRLLTYEEPAQIPVTLEAVRTSTPPPTYTVPTPAPAIFGNRLEDHAPVTAFLDPGGVAIFPIYAAAEQNLTIGVSPGTGSTLQPEIEIVNPEGLIIATAQSATSNAGGDALITSLYTTTEGTYQVYLRGSNNSTGTYIISYGTGETRLDALQGPAAFDTGNTAIIDKRALRHIWTANLQAGDIISVNVNPGSSSILDPILEIVPASDPTQIIATDDNSGGGRSALIREVSINQTGLYLFRVRASAATSLGEYTLIWRYVNVAPTGTPPPARSPLLTIQDSVPDSAYNFYPFYGLAGQRVQIRVTGQGEFDPVAALIAPDGVLLVEVDDTDGDLNPTLVYELTADGTYNVRVNGYISGGTFELNVEALY